jgi:hypothetical protein
VGSMAQWEAVLPQCLRAEIYSMRAPGTFA